jgi:hypothetical protein
MFITVKIFFFFYSSYSQKEKNKRAHKKIFVYTQVTIHVVFIIKKKKKLNETEKRRGSVWYEIVLKKDFTDISLRKRERESQTNKKTIHTHTHIQCIVYSSILCIKNIVRANHLRNNQYLYLYI